MKTPFLEFNGKWLEQGSMVRALLMYQFLQISPSYALAHKVKTQRIEFPQQILLVSDLYEIEATDEAFRDVWIGFEKILENHVLFGDVFSVPFPIWWSDLGGYELFGYKEPKPSVTLITSLARSKKPNSLTSENINRYLLKARPAENNPPVHIFAVPAGIGLRKQLTLVKQKLESMDSEIESTPYVASEPEFKFAGERLRPRALISYLQVFFCRAAFRDKSLWQIGAAANISKTHSAQIPNPLKARPSSANAYTREVLNILTNRAILRAQRTAENAARGNFPVHNAIPLPRHDWEAIFQQIEKLPSLKLPLIG
jgi:hypothetical protein